MFTAKKFVEVINNKIDYVPYSEKRLQLLREYKENKEQYIENSRVFCNNELSEELRAQAKEGVPVLKKYVLECTPEPDYISPDMYRPIFIPVLSLDKKNKSFTIPEDSKIYDKINFRTILSSNGYSVKFKPIDEKVKLTCNCDTCKKYTEDFDFISIVEIEPA